MGAALPRACALGYYLPPLPGLVRLRSRTTGIRDQDITCLPIMVASKLREKRLCRLICGYPARPQSRFLTIF